MAGVEVTIEGPVLRLHLCRPDKKNAITSAMYLAMVEGLSRLEADRELRVGLLSAAGPDYCAGNDVFEFDRPPGSEMAPGAFIEALATASKPLVAAVRGRAIGIGATMLLHCDLVYVTPDADLRFPFVDLGLVPEAGSTLLLPALVGRRRAAELLMLARPLTGRRAAELGIANETVADGDLDQVARDAAATLAAKPPEALRATKSLMRSYPESLLEHSAQELTAFRRLLDGPEFAAALDRFRSR